jgi:hypothetical protein
MENKKTRKNGAQDNEHVYHCPMCGSTDLEVIDCRVIGHMELTDEGFIPEGDTTDEIILCRFCSHKDKMQRFMDSKNTQKKHTIREIVKEYPELYDYDYKWKDSDNYRELSEVLKERGYELADAEIKSGEYNDLKAYLDCEIIKITGGE